MRVVFADKDQDSAEYEIEAEDLKQLVQIAENLSDSELEKVGLAIDNFSQPLPVKSTNRRIQEA